MKRKIISILIIFLLVIQVVPSYAKMKKLAQTGFQFLNIGLSARAEAMGGAYSLVGGGANSMFYNPAGLSHMDANVEIVGHNVQWIADISYNAFGAALNTGNYGVFGIHFAAVDYGRVIGTQVASTEKGFVETGDVDVGAYFGGIAYARQLTDKFHIGGQVKYVYEHLGYQLISDTKILNNKAGSFAYDFGTIYYTGLRSLRVGINIRNFSEEIKYQEYGFQMPLIFKIGFAMNLMDFIETDHSVHSIEFGFDAIHPRDYTERINVGAEYWYRGMFALRGGYKFNHDVEHLTMGMGFKYEISGTNLHIDYCNTHCDYFDNVDRISLGISF